jgi:hypothetical protein
MWNLYKGMNCTSFICIVLLWLIPQPIVFWLTCGSMEYNKDVCVRVRGSDTVLEKQYETQNYSLCNFLYSILSSSLFNQNVICHT